MVTFTTTMTALTLADSEMPIISSSDMAQTIRTAGRLMIPGSGSHGQCMRLGGSSMPKECSSLTT